MKKILISGGTGLVGTRLGELLREQGFEVAVLSRRSRTDRPVRYFRWDVEQGEMDEGALAWADAVVHLAGAGVADERWTDRRKREILESRTHSTRLLREALARGGHSVQAFVAATAIGLYGDGGEREMSEDSPPGSDFLAEVTKAWEAEVDRIEGPRVVKIRVGIVLSTRGGALVEMARPVKLFAGAALGTGRQWQSWIHLDDLCRLFIHALREQGMAGAYNGVAPHPVRNAELIAGIAKQLGRPLVLPPVPAFAMRLLLGEMAEMVLSGCRVSAAKTASAGFEWQYPRLEEALQDLYGEG